MTDPTTAVHPLGGPRRVHSPMARDAPVHPGRHVVWLNGRAAHGTASRRTRRSLFLYEPSLPGVVEDPRLFGGDRDGTQGPSPRSKRNRWYIDGAVRSFVEWITRIRGVLMPFQPSSGAWSDDNARTFDLHLKAPPVTISRTDVRRLRVPLTLVHGAETRRVYAIVTETPAQPGSRIERFRDSRRKPRGTTCRQSGRIQCSSPRAPLEAWRLNLVLRSRVGRRPLPPHSTSHRARRFI